MSAIEGYANVWKISYS